ncbi:MAG: hypothetical protein HY820_02625 [Acidobacteria bacterium]|nr:hypothetical protein [Acidobacteriota bacterium]
MPLFAILLTALCTHASAAVDLSRAVVVVRPGNVPLPEQTAAIVLVEEIERRSGIRLPVAQAFPQGRPAIAITSTKPVPQWGREAPTGDGRPEGFRLRVDGDVVWIAASDPRGALYGVAHLLRQLDWDKGKLQLPTPLDVTTSPALPIRGHQLGYRTTANSWDAWTIPQFERYIRELALFGMNSVEGIPFQDDKNNPLMKVPRREMNRAISEICRRYGLDYWVWTPADFDLNDGVRRAKSLAAFDELFADAPELTGVFVPGGDPGSNPPDLVLAFMEDIAKRARPRHPKAKVWVSLQGFNSQKAGVVYSFLQRGVPDWFGGIVAGPSSPPVAETRRMIPPSVKLRLYPDVTHNKLSQFEVPGWDQAYALTLGREAVNPRPAEYAAIHKRITPFSDGFISYSDGVHDDVNKIVFTALSWDPERKVRDILVEYCRVYFRPDLAEDAADGLLALERNWRGVLADNGGVQASLAWWRALERRTPDLSGNWRWQMHLLRAHYDAHVRMRLRHDTALEDRANAILLDAGRMGVDAAIAAAKQVLATSGQPAAGKQLRDRILELCQQLFDSIGLQTSVEMYHASNPQRGAVLDFVDLPLNNRWWLEDELEKVRKLASRVAQVARLRELATWEHPGPGSFYDNVGRIGKAQHVVYSQDEEDATPLFWWWDNGKSRARLSWQVTMWPKEMVYEGLDPKARYLVRTTGYGQALLRIDGERIKPAIDGREMAEYKEWIVPSAALADGKLTLTWDRATDEQELNWRRRSRLAEVWLLKR